jgi:hypothetical protein
LHQIPGEKESPLMCLLSPFNPFLWLLFPYVILLLLSFPMKLQKILTSK